MAKEDARQKAIRTGMVRLRAEGLSVDDPSPALVGALRDRTGKGQETDLAVVFVLGRIADLASLEALTALEQTAADRAVKREVRRSLFKLAQKGLSAPSREPAPEAREKPVFRLGGESEAYLSSVDGAGNRMVWLAKTQAGSGVLLLQGIASDREGLREAGGGLLRRRELRRMMREIKEKHGVTMIAIPGDYADHLLHSSYEKAKASGRPGLERYAEMRARMGASRPEARPHPIYDHLDPREIRSGPGRESSQRLLEEPEFRYWIVDEDWLRPHIERVREAQGSRLVLNPLQKEERVAGVVRDAVRELFSGEAGVLFAARMEDMALYLLLTGREDKARLALAVALALKDKDLGGLGVPFLDGLMQKSLSLALAQEKGKPEEPSLIIKP